MSDVRNSPLPPIMQSPPGAETVIDGRPYVYFVGTGYLGLQGHPEVIRAACEATRQYGLASATSRSGFGNTPPTLDVERLAAQFFGMDASFYYVSGYVGNQILVLLADGQFDAVFVDELSHYSVFEAARLANRPIHGFSHRDPESLAVALRSHLRPRQKPLVMSDGVFAGLGRIAPVAEYREVLMDYPGSILAIDDAHAVGVLGASGRGTFEHAGLYDSSVNTDIPGQSGARRGPSLFFSGTLSKAIGGFGGILPGRKALVDRLKRTSHYYNGASTLPAPVAAATARALELVMAQPEMRRRLGDNVRQMKAGLRALGLEADDTPVPIVCLKLGSADNMQRIQRELAERGVLVAYMAAYSGLGPEGALRVAIFATHTEAMIRRLLEELARVV